MAEIRCLICAHPKATEIDKALAMPGATVASVARLFNTTTGPLTTHKKQHIPSFLVAAQAAHRVDRGINVEGELFKNNHLYDEIVESAQRLLDDPDNPGHITLEPRATEISIVIQDASDLDERGKPKKKKITLQSAIDMVVAGGVLVQWTPQHSVDIRDYLFAALEKRIGTLRLYAEMRGLLQDNRKNEFDEREFYKKEIERLTKDEGWSHEQAVSILLAADDTGLASQYIN